MAAVQMNQGIRNMTLALMKVITWEAMIHLCKIIESKTNLFIYIDNIKRPSSFSRWPFKSCCCSCTFLRWLYDFHRFDQVFILLRTGDRDEFLAVLIDELNHIIIVVQFLGFVGDNFLNWVNIILLVRSALIILDGFERCLEIFLSLFVGQFHNDNCVGDVCWYCRWYRVPLW